MATTYIFSEFEGLDKTKLMKLMLEYLYEEMPYKFDGNEDMMDFIQGKLKEEEEEETTIVENIKCNKCRYVLPPHTIKEHLDTSNPIHKCPHK